MRIVIDSNVWVSALVFGGMPRKVLETVVQRGHTIVLSQEILTEVRRVLHAKFPDFTGDFEDLLVAVAPRVQYIALGSLHVDVCRDPDDNRVLETAVLGGAACIVSGDRDSLTLGAWERVSIVVPSDFLR